VSAETRRRGRVFNRGASWYYSVDVNVPGAERKRILKGGHPSQRAAQTALNSVLRDLERSTYVKPDRKRTLGAYLDEVYLPSLTTRGLKASTIESYGRNIALHIKPKLGKIPMVALTPELLDRAWAGLLDEGLSSRTVRYVATIVGAATRQAVRQGVLAVDPMTRSTPPQPGQRAEMTVWTADQLSTFLTATRDTREAGLYHLLAMTGCRRGEALGLMWGDLDLDSGEMHVRRAAGWVNGQRVVETPKTRAGARTISLDSDTVTVLKGHRKRTVAERLAMGEAYIDQGWVFVEPDGDPVNPRNVTMTFVRRSRRLGLPAIRLHDLRHSWATLALRAGVNPKVVQERLGHTNISVTLGIYSHVSADTHREAADAVAALVTRGS
jgi:integrase